MSSELYSKYPSDSGSTQGIQDESGAARLLKLPLALALNTNQKSLSNLLAAPWKHSKGGRSIIVIRSKAEEIY